MRRALAVILLLVSSAALASCTADASSTAEPQSGDDTVAPATAVVETRTISDVLTVSFTVTAGAEYTVSAPSIGALHERDGQYSFRPSGEAQAGAIPLPLTHTAVEPLVPLGVEVGSGTPMLRVQDAALTASAPLTAAQILRIAERTPLHTRAQIDGSSGPFDCPVNDPRPTAAAEGFVVSCRIPAEVPSIVGATGVLALTLADEKDVLALPIEAVAGTRARGLVYTELDGAPREVVLGVSNGAHIEIVDGLSEGDTVLIPSPSLLNG